MAALPEIAEAQAEGHVVVLYADIRQVLGVPFVNLIYRHLATAPAVLDCVWHALRPHFVSGAFAAQAALLRQEVAAIVERWPVKHVGPSPEGARHGAVRLVRMYNEANSLNLTALRHLLWPSAGPGGPQADAQAGARHVAGAAPEPSPIPRLPEFWELHQREVERIHRLNEYAEPGTPAMVASLYRHLAAWPGVLQEVEAVLAPLQERGLLGEGRNLAGCAAARNAAAHPLPMPPLVHAFHEGYEMRLRQFAEITISKMIPIGMALDKAFTARPSKPSA